jgi:hypothetical protein
VRPKDDDDGEGGDDNRGDSGLMSHGVLTSEIEAETKLLPALGQRARRLAERRGFQ